MLVISKGDKTLLPIGHHFVNNICAYIYDQLTEVLRDPFYSEMNSTEISYNGDEEFKKLILDDKIHLISALDISNRKDELHIVLAKHITMSIISDMVNFIYESLDNAKKGKMTVAYALLRKPFTDQLLILEQILIDKTDFIERFYHNGNPTEYDPSSKALNKELIIQSAIKKLKSINVFDAYFIYQVRYDKSYDGGINSITNQALHIVTLDKKYPTNNQSFNFMFSQEEDIKNYWEHFYTSVPILLLYTVSIVDEIVFDFIKDDSGQKEDKYLRRLIATQMLLDKPKASKYIYGILGKLLVTDCKICGQKNKFDKADFKLFFFEDVFLCRKCYNPLMLNDETRLKFKESFALK